MHILTHLLVLTNLAFIFGLTSTASTVTPSQNDVVMLNQIIVLNQIIRHETRQRLILEDTVKQLMADFENLKQELLTNFSNSGIHSCNCNSKNVTEELKDFKTNYRYMTLSLLDIQQKTDVMQGLSKIFVSTFFLCISLKLKQLRYKCIISYHLSLDTNTLRILKLSR